MHLPEKYGKWRGVHNRLRMWAVDDTFRGGLTTKIHLAADEAYSSPASANTCASAASGQ